MLTLFAAQLEILKIAVGVLAVQIALAQQVPATAEKVINPKPELHTAATSTRTIEGWISALSKCESGGKWNALNPRDTDGTPSISEFQFKRPTFRKYVKKYDLFGWQNWDLLAWEMAIWNGNMQREVVRNMVLDKGVNFYAEFPNCVKNVIGLPPSG